MRRTCLILLATTLLSLPIRGQEKVWLAGVGYDALLDTYLSQEHYGGIEVDLLHEMTKAYKRDSLLSRTNYYHLALAMTDPRSGAATDYTALFDYSFGMHYTFPLASCFDLAIGGQGDFFIGGIYNTRNGNNPAQLKLGIDIAPSLRAAYRFRLFKKAMRLKYCASLPLLGMQFAPAYGQSYYEIFGKGEYDNNVCFSWVGNALSFSHRLTLDIFFRHTALTFGYLSDLRQAELHSIKYHSYSHLFVVGVTL